MKKDRATRRDFLKTGMAASAAIFPLPAIAQGTAARVVVIGGGFGGAACARTLKRSGANLSVTLIEPNRIYTACPMSNAAIAGLRELTRQDFSYGRLQSEGVETVFASAEAVDAAARKVAFGGGQRIEYDRLILAPGIDFRWEALPGYSREVSATMPHAWFGGDQISLLARQIAAMDDGGVVLVSVPVTPSRCPPAPYERVSLIAHMLKTRKPRSKVIVLDAKDSFTMQRQFQGAWKQLYPSVLEYVSLSDGGLVTEIDAGSMTVSTDFDKYKPAVANIIPQQKAGMIAEIAGVADRTGWCPVDPVTFESKLQPNIHVIGDAAIAGAMPRSASAAISQATICAAAVVTMLTGEKPKVPTLNSSCFSLIAPDYAISQTGRYQPIGDIYTEEMSNISPVDAPQGLRVKEAGDAKAWYSATTAEVFG